LSFVLFFKGLLKKILVPFYISVQFQSKDEAENPEKSRRKNQNLNIMALAFQIAKVHFDPTSGQIQNEPGVAIFPSNIRVAEIALRSFDIGYTDGDHHIWREKVVLKDKNVIGTTVTFSIDYLFRDSSGNIDDRFDGVIEVLVIADLEDVNPRQPILTESTFANRG
jgi:hypothetical protein